MRPAAGGRLRHAIDALGSGRLAVALLAVLILFLLLHLLGLAGLRRSTWLYATLALLFVNLLLCMIRRFRAALSLCRFPAEPPPVIAGWSQRQIPARRLGPPDVSRILRGRGYRTLVAGDTVYGLRGRFAVAGHLIFHVSLLLLVAIGAALAARPSPFRGTIGLGEGETFDLHQARFLATNGPLPPGTGDLRFELEKVDVATEGEDVTRLEALLSTPGGGRATLGINRPYRFHPYQVMVHGFGHMPGWVIVDPDGRMLGGSWVKLLPFPLEGEDSFPIGPRTSEVRVRFHPEGRAGDGGGAGGADEAGSPRFEARIRLLGEPIFEGLLAPGERVALGDGRTFFFLPDIRRYLLLDVIRETGHRLVFACLGLMILGLALRYTRLRKEIVARVDGDSLRLHGRCEILESLFEEELDRLAGACRRAAGGSDVRGTGEGGTGS